MVGLGLKNADVNTFCSLAVLTGGFVKLYNLVRSLTSLTPLVHLLSIVIDHLVGAVAGDGFGLAISATGFQEIDCGVLTKTLEGVFKSVAPQIQDGCVLSPSNDVGRAH